MSGTSGLDWLPGVVDADGQLAAIKREIETATRLAGLRKLASTRLDPLQTQKLARLVAATFAEAPATEGLTTVRLAWLSSSTVEHLVPLLLVAGLRWGLRLEVYIGPYGQYRQEVLDPASALARFCPQVVLFDLDPAGVLPEKPLAAALAEVEAAVEQRAGEMVGLWQAVQQRFAATVVQQSVPVIAEPLFGAFERRVPGTSTAALSALNAALAAGAAREGVLLFDLDALSAREGKDAWFDPVRWHHAKHLVSPGLALTYVDHLARLLAATRGRAKKCLVLDLDNTLWGGVVGDDGVGGLALGQGSPSGEAYLSFQHHCRRLAERGVVLAVCSKNDSAVAEAAFRDHPEMVLRRELIACFVANWEDKASNLRRIAGELNLGLDSLVFFDDNPAERDLVRRELPMVSVPEPPEDPAYYARCLGRAGYFEAVAFTSDDLARVEQYRANAERAQLLGAATDMAGYLESLGMRLEVAPCDGAHFTRVAQLINKTNQFNLTTRRYAESDLRALLGRGSTLAQCHRLTDRFGDNGIIGVVLGELDAEGRCIIDTWLMSCRVLGRGVEATVLNAVAAEARARGARVLLGEYRPSAKNGMVRDHYQKLGFAPGYNPGSPEPASAEATWWTLPLHSFQAIPAPIAVTGMSHE